MKTEQIIPRVLFNASVVFSAFCSETGASRKLMTFIKRKRINGLISEAILDELLKHADKIPADRERLCGEIDQYFGNILPAPEEKNVSRYKQFMLDEGDAHLFATYQEARCDALVSLDKHHVLALKGKLPGCTILAPSELLQRLRKHR